MKYTAYKKGDKLMILKEGRKPDFVYDEIIETEDCERKRKIN